MRFILSGLLIIVGVLIYVFVNVEHIFGYANETVVIEQPQSVKKTALDKTIPLSKIVIINKEKLAVTEAKAEQCENLDVLQVTTADLKEKQSLQIIQFAEQLKKQKINKRSQETIIQQANVSLDRFRELTAYVRERNDDFLWGVKEKPVIAPLAIRNTFHQYLLAANYEGIIAQVQSGQLSSHSIVGKYNVLGTLLLHDKKIELTVVEQLINAGLTPTFPDWVRMTQDNRSVELLQMLVRPKGDEVNQRWYHNYRYNTLTMLAAERLNYELFEFWLDNGSSVMAKLDDYTALDVIKIPTTPQELEQATEIFIALANRNVNPYKINTLDIIKSWLPLETQRAFASYFEQYQPAVLSDADSQISSELANRLAVVNDELKVAEQQLQACNKLIAVNRGIDDIVVDNELEQKNSVEQPDPHTQQLTTRLINASNNNDWDDFLSASYDLAELWGDPFLSITLMQAIEQNAPFKIIKSLLDGGASLNSRAIHILSMRGHLNLTKKLLAYGLDLYAIDPQNRNALYYAVAFDSTSKMFDFLLDNNVDVLPNTDLLSVLLAKSALNRCTYYCAKLIANGHKVTPLHLNRLAQIKINNKKQYDALVPVFQL